MTTIIDLTHHTLFNDYSTARKEFHLILSENHIITEENGIERVKKAKSKLSMARQNFETFFVENKIKI
jgi:hypothetical protein